MNIEKKVTVSVIVVNLILTVGIILFGYYKLNYFTTKIKELDDRIKAIENVYTKLELKIDNSYENTKNITAENNRLKTTVIAINKRIELQEECIRILLAQLKSSNHEYNFDKITKKLDKEKKKMEKKLKKAAQDDNDDNDLSMI